MKSKVLPLLLAFCLVGFTAIAGCSSMIAGDPDPAPNESVDPEEDVTIQFMHLWPETSSAAQYNVVSRIIEEYEAEHPNVTIETEVLENEQYKNRMRVLAVSNDLPDVGVSWAAGYLEPFVIGKLLAPLDDLLNGELNGMFVPGTAEAYAIDGVTYSLPIELNIAPIFYNKEIFEAYRLEPPATYDEFKAIIQTLVENGVAPIALGNNDKWTGSMWYMYMADRIGGMEPLKAVLDRTGSFEVPMFIEAAKQIQELVDMGAFIKGFNGLSNEEGKSEFMNERAAMFLAGSWELPNYTTNPDVPQDFKDKIGFMPFPEIEGGAGSIKNWVGGPGVGLFVAENSKVKVQAKHFLAYFIHKWGEYSATEAGVIPATKVDTSKVALHPLYIEMLNELGSANNLIMFYDVLMKPASAETHKDLIQALFGKAVSPEEFAKQQEEAMVQEYGR